MSVKVVYLASPYTSPSPEVRARRVELASLAAAQFMQQGLCVFSPITHGHHIAGHLPAEVLTDHEFWMGQCKPILVNCDAMLVLPLTGWRQSRGLTEELAFCKENGIPVFIIQELPHGCSGYLERLTTEEFTANGWSRINAD